MRWEVGISHGTERANQRAFSRYALWELRSAALVLSRGSIAGAGRPARCWSLVARIAVTIPRCKRHLVATWSNILSPSSSVLGHCCSSSDGQWSRHSSIPLKPARDERGRLNTTTGNPIPLFLNPQNHLGFDGCFSSRREQKSSEKMFGEGNSLITTTMPEANIHVAGEGEWRLFRMAGSPLSLQSAARDWTRSYNGSSTDSTLPRHDGDRRQVGVITCLTNPLHVRTSPVSSGQGCLLPGKTPLLGRRVRTGENPRKVLC